MKKILFLINTLGGGGAERVLINLVNKLDQTKYEITVETMFDGGVNQQDLASSIHYIEKKVPCFRGISMMFKFIPSKLLYAYFIGNKKYDMVISYMHGAPAKVLSGCKDKNIKKIVWLHNGDMENSNFFGFWLTKQMAVNAYASYDAIAGVAKSVVSSFSNYTGISEKIHVVYNTNDFEKIMDLSKRSPELPFAKRGPLLVTVGRVDNSKGYDRLIPVAKQLHEDGLKFDLVIVGTGRDYEKLSQLVVKLNAINYIHMVGFRTNPYSIIAQADLFVSSSRFEGLSTVISEAIILGVPVLSTDVSGAREVLGDNNEYGIVVDNNDEALYKGLKGLLSNENLLKEYKKKTAERTTFFDSERTVHQAEQLIESVFSN